MLQKKPLDDNVSRKIWQEKPENRFKQYIFLIIVIVITLIFTIFYVSQDSTKLGTCKKNSDCIYFEINDMWGSKYICVNQDLSNITKLPLTQKVLINKYKKSYSSSINGHCECIKNLCAVQPDII